MRMSKSAVLAYLQCPYRFYVEFIQRLPRKVTPPQLKKGSEVHELLDKFYDAPVKTIKEAKEVIKKEPKYKEHKKEIDNFVKLNEEVISEGKEQLIKPIFKEVKIYDRETNIAGIIDAVMMDTDKLILLDYKTGKFHPIENYRFELALYTYLFEKHYNQKITHWGIYFAKTNRLIVEEKDVKEMVKSINKVREIRSLIKQKKFEKKRSRWCRSCPVFQSGYCQND